MPNWKYVIVTNKATAQMRKHGLSLAEVKRCFEVPQKQEKVPGKPFINFIRATGNREVAVTGLKTEPAKWLIVNAWKRTL